ncbi:MAG: hypothetical protein LBJ16_00800 [Holosporaceae bacterium]|jgi:hypothetical protein|nr:hypothetical protein [Holosporaceae bacterium]
MIRRSLALFLSCSSLFTLSDVRAGLGAWDIAYTSDMMTTLPVNLVGGMMALVTENILRLRVGHCNIEYVKDKDGGSDCNAHNIGTDAVTILLISMFPSNGSVLSIETKHSGNLSHVLNGMPRNRVYKFFAALFLECNARRRRAVSNITDLDSWLNTCAGSDTVDNLDPPAKSADKKKNSQSRKKDAHERRITLQKILDKTGAAAEFERDEFFYSDYTTETLLMAFCCKYFNGNDVPEFLAALSQEGLIDNFDLAAFKARSRADLQTVVDRKCRSHSNMTPEEFLLATCGKPFPVVMRSGLDFGMCTVVSVTIADGLTAKAMDCCEDSLRSLLEIFCDYNAAENELIPNRNWDPRVIAFFEKYKKVTYVGYDSYEMHQEWFDLCIKMEAPGVKHEWGGFLLSSPFMVVQMLNVMMGAGLTLSPKDVDSLEDAVRFLQMLVSGGKVRQDLSFDWSIVLYRTQNAIECLVKEKTNMTNSFAFALRIDTGYHVSLAVSSTVWALTTDKCWSLLSAVDFLTANFRSFIAEGRRTVDDDGRYALERDGSINVCCGNWGYYTPPE